MGIKHFINTLIHKDYDIIIDEFEKFSDDNLDAILLYLHKKKPLSNFKNKNDLKYLSFSVKEEIIKTKEKVLSLFEEKIMKAKENEMHQILIKKFEEELIDESTDLLLQRKCLNEFIVRNKQRYSEIYGISNMPTTYLNFDNWRHLEFVLNHLDEYHAYADKIIERNNLLAKKEKEITALKEQKIKDIEEEHRINSLSLIQQKALTISDNSLYGIPFKFFYKYYPVSEGSDISREDWEARKLIWNFKGKKKEPEAKTEPIVFKSLQYSSNRSSHSHEHDNAVSRVARMVRNSLRASFGINMKHLTFVCITASTKESNQVRYEMFSKIVCGSDIIKDERLINAYEHIQVLQDAVPKHLGGTGLPSLHFDEEFFRGKYVVLFDDVVTSGGSMMRYVDKLRSMGAVVVALYAIGKTTYK